MAASSGKFKGYNEAVKRGAISPKRAKVKSKTHGESREAYMKRTGSWSPF